MDQGRGARVGIDYHTEYYGQESDMPIPHQLTFDEYTLSGITALNIVVGRNGSGKSRFLRGLAGLRGQAGHLVRYISPERAGSFMPDSNLENAERGNKSWAEDQRQTNQVSNFKQMSAVRLKELAMRFAVRMENDLALRSDFTKTFVTVQLAKINAMLSNVVVEREGAQEFVFKTVDGNVVTADRLSSGESEILALATEVLHFFESCGADRFNVLLLDEPDVHLHPDLQARFARFLLRELEGLPASVRERTVVCVATHSTPLVCELAFYNGCSIGTKEFASNTVVQRAVSDQLRKMAPFFGHPLSKAISDDTPLILEGEDDERIWQQAARTAKGRLKVFPCLATSVDRQTELEQFCDSFLSAVYDRPTAISVRDGDGVRGTLESIGCVRRFRLQCYAAENLLATDEVLVSLNSSWPAFVVAGKAWCAAHAGHQGIALLTELLNSTDRLRDKKIKDIRQLIPAVLGSTKPWEVVVGQVLGRVNDATDQGAQHGIVAYVGIAALRAVGLMS